MSGRDCDEAPVLRIQRPDGTGMSFVPDTREFRDAIAQRERDGYRVLDERRRGDDKDQRNRERQVRERERRRRG